jgi:acyl-coenzyme A synthetase/AMP-(fatty) acid ligase
MLHIFCSNTVATVRPGSSGVAVPGYDLRIVDDDDAPITDDRTGTLWVRGGSAAPSYWRRREKSLATMRGEWMVTGDRYRRDNDGFYWYEGRADDMIKVGGEWVSPIEIENTLLEHPAVHEAAVVGVTVNGVTRIKAVVIPSDGHDPKDTLKTALQTWCKERLQRYQYPHIVEFVADLPQDDDGQDPALSAQRAQLTAAAR